MLNRLRNEESGFTLVELLVVILIIGILAAIALPVFLGQQKKGQDASAKSDARNAVSQVESCYADEQDYANCASALTGAGLSAKTTLAVGTSAGTGNSYVISSESKSGNIFKITKTTAGLTSRTCTTGGNGGCPTSQAW